MVIKMDCIFCKIINNEIPSYTIYEDELVKVILDINPSVDGHALIIPKKQEIVTKAVVGKAKKNSVSKFVVKPEETPDTILGCWVINHNFEGKNQNGVVNINGAFDVNVWYSYNNDTKTAVSTKRFQYNDKMN